MKKVICFCRVSSVQQDLENQKREVTKAIVKDGFKVSEIVFVEGKESAIKLEEMQRQTLSEMKDVVAKNPSIKDVYFYAIDRLARKVSIVLSIVDQMTAKGINLHFLNPYPMQTMRDGKEDAMGKMFLTFLSIGAEMEMKMKKERFATARKIMKAEGKLVTGTVLFGYYRDGNGYPQIKEKEAVAVRKIFDLYLSGVSMRQIAKQMIIEGYFNNESLNSINSGIVKVSNIINNTAYSGRQAKQFDSKEEKSIKYPAIVDIETQNKAIQLAANNMKTKDTKNIYYAKSLVKMAFDDKEYVLSPIKGNCSYGINYIGGQFNININVVDSIAWMEAQKLYNITVKHADKIQPQTIRKNIEDNEKKIANLQPIYEKYEASEKRLNKLYMLGRLNYEEYEIQYNEIADEKKIYINEELRLKSEIKKYENEIERIKNRSNESVDFSTISDEQKRNLCKEMIEKIMIEKVGKYEYTINVIPSNLMLHSVVIPTYYYNVSGGKKRLYITIGNITEDISETIIQRFQAAARKRG